MNNKTILFLAALLLGTLLSCNSQAKENKIQTSEGNDNVLPSWAFGGFVRPAGVNPVINPDPSSTFYCPMNEEIVKWEESDTFNPAAVVKDGKICVLYRAEDNSATGIGKRVSRVALAESEDGITMVKRDAPVLYPADDNNKQYEWPGGCEDPRTAVTEDGTYVIFYTSWDRSTARLCVATSTDLLTWEKHGPVFAKAYDGKYLNTWSKASSIVTEVKDGEQVIAKIDGKYFMYWGEYRTHAATSENLVDWTPIEKADGSLLVLADTRKGHFDSDLVECGPPAVMTDKGILMLYNGKNATNADADPRFNRGTYSAGQMLFDKNDPTKLIERTDVPFFRPMEDYEKSGQYVDGTVFIEGLVFFKEKWFLYYGCADSKVGVAIFDPADPALGDPIPDLPQGEGFGVYPRDGVGKKKISIHSSSGQVNAGESAFNLLYSHINPRSKWCEDKNENPWVVFEFNDYYNVSKLVFRDVSPYENGNGNVPEYWIYASLTGTEDDDWEEIVHKTGQESVSVKTDEFATPVEARYIKFVASRGTRTDNGNKENAIRIYGFDFHGELSRTVERGDLVSQGKTVMAFHKAENYYEEPLHLLDGNFTNSLNKWNFNKATTSEPLRYVVIDLEEEYDVAQFKIYDVQTIDSKSRNNIDGYAIYVSTEAPNLELISSTEDTNTVWTKVVDTEGRQEEAIKTDIIDPIKARYVKLEIPRSGTKNITSLYQFEVYKKGEGDAISVVKKESLNICPNILKSGETLSINNTEEGTLNIYSLQGGLVHTQKVATSAKVSLQLPGGTYVAEVSTEKGTKQSGKLIIQ